MKRESNKFKVVLRNMEDNIYVNMSQILTCCSNADCHSGIWTYLSFYPWLEALWFNTAWASLILGEGY